MLGVLREVPERRPDGRPRRVDPGDQHEVADADHVGVGHRLAIHLGGEQLGDQIVLTRVRPPISELADEELDDLVAARQAHNRIGEPDLEHPSDPAGELVRHLERHTEHRRDHTNGDLLRVVRCGIRLPGFDEAIDQSMAEVACARLVLRHRLG